MTNFITLEMLHTLPYSCANRDVSNSPKTAQYPGGVRARISSQSFKRQQRLAMKDQLNTMTFSDRSRHLPKMLMDYMPTYTTPEGETPFAEHTREQLRLLVGEFFPKVLGIAVGSEKEQKDKGYLKVEGDGIWDERTQILLHFSPEHALPVLSQELYTYTLDPKAVRKASDILTDALHSQDSIDVGLFGIMLASSSMSLRVDGALSVAQTITVHPMQLEVDFWTTMGDFASDSHQGSENMGTALFSHGVFYSAQTLDLRQLRKNLPNLTEEEFEQVVSMVIQSFAQYKPAAKKTNSAPFGEPAFIMATLSDRQVNHSTEFYSHPVSFEERIEERAAERLLERALKDKNMFSEDDQKIITLSAYDEVNQEQVEKAHTLADLQEKVIRELRGA